jgi:hypothetical protein
MKILNIYDEKDDAEEALLKITGDKKVVSDREDNKVIYKLFGQATWSNFYQMDMFNLKELKKIVEAKKNDKDYDVNRHNEILQMLKYSSRSFDLDIPEHWL